MAVFLTPDQRGKPVGDLGRAGRAIRTTGGVLALACVVWSAAGAAASLPAPTPAEQQALEDSRRDIDAGRAERAYVRLLAHEPVLAGLPEYDYLLGQAALGAGQHTRAAFALERCLAVEPRHGACRLTLVRAHLAMAETTSARREIDIIAQSSPPAGVQKLLDDYRNLLSGREPAGQDTRLNAYVQLGTGYDSNYNNATTLSSLALPLFNNLVFSLNRGGREKDSGFNRAQFNIRYSTPLSGTWRLLAEGNLSTTLYWDSHRYNNAVADVSLGATRREGQHQFTFKVQGQHYRLGRHAYRNMAAALGQYTYSLSDHAELTAFLHASRFTYPGASLRNANRYTAGLSVSQALAGGRSVAFISGYGGREAATHRAAPDEYDQRFVGARLGGMVLLNHRTQLEAGVGAEWRRYDGQERLFLRSRRETVYDAYAGLNYAINRQLSVRPQYRYVRTHSTIPLYAYQRHVVTLSLRYELL